MSTDNDEDLLRALELSRQSYEEEQKRRSLNEPDLISFDSPEEVEQREKINRIKSLITQSSFDGSTGSQHYGCRPELTPPISIAPSSSFPLLQSTSVPQNFSPSISIQQFQQQGPPRPPKNFPPNPCIPLLRTNTAPPLPPRSKPPSSRQSLSFVPSIGQRVPTPPPISTLPSQHQNCRIYPLLLPTATVETTTLEPQHIRRPSNFSSSLYDYLDADLYVPHTITTNNIMNGDLIDLNDPESAKDNCGSATLEQIQREFDPLYRVSPEKDGIAMAPAPINRQEIHYTVPAIKSLPVISKDDENKENQEERWLSLNDLVFRPFLPSTLRQIGKLKESGRKQVSESSLFFQAPTVDYLTTNIESIKVVIQTDYTFPRKETCSFVFDPSTTVDLITTQALSALLPENETLKQYSTEEYGLKVFGLDEYLPSTSQLGHSVYVGKCLLHGKDVKLEIGKLVPPRRRPKSEQPQWEQMKSTVKYHSVLDQQDVENVKYDLEVAMKDYEKSYNSGNTLSIASESNKVRQQVKSLCDMLNSIEPMNLHTALQSYLTAATLDQLQCCRNDFIAALHNFIYVYCKSTMSRCQLEPLRAEPTKTLDIVECTTQKLKVMINSLHNLPVDWLRDYSSFDITVNVYHGTRLMDTHSDSISKSAKLDALFPYVPMQFYVVFNHALCFCPRETKIMFVLNGTSAFPQQSPDDYKPDIKKHLAFGSVPLFDYQMLMQQGQLFVPLTILKDSELKPWGPHPLIAKKNDPILVVTLPHYDFQIKFPDVVVEFQSAKQDFFSLKTDDQSTLMDIIESGETEKLSTEEMELLWQKRSYLMDQPEALPLVLNSVTDWGYGFLSNVYQILEEWTPLTPVQAMQMLLPQYPDQRVRSKAIEWILQASTDFLFNAIPQLVEALRFELFESSSLATALLSLSYTDRRFAFEIYWQLMQRVDHCVDYAYAQRCNLLQEQLVERHASDNLEEELTLQHQLLNHLDCLQLDLRLENNDETRLYKLRSTLGILDSVLLRVNVHLPILPSFKCSGVSVAECSIFNSNAKPLKIVFKGISSNYAIIHKSGDDMRQDALVLQMVGLMNDIWLSEGLDLRVVLFRCMPVGFRKGMAELVSDCSTLCDIQKECGMTGVFRDDVLTNWLQKHNSSEFLYKMALDNFTRSCAAWCVATYILGIGDRHNDNILVTTTGHVFHIDFGKYMGDWQTAAGFKRDRVPFVFTADMYHVINGGSEQRETYQTFIDYCCRAFNYIRQKHVVLFNILKIMACSDIAGVNMKSLQFVEKNLMLDLSETDAVIQFTELINACLKSAFPRLNFFVHTLAQMMSGHTQKDSPDMLSFVPQLYTRRDEGTITDVRVTNFEKRMLPHKVYLYKTMVQRENHAVSTFIYRTFDEYNELYVKLRRRFPSVVFPVLSTGTRMRNNIAEVAQRRLLQIQQFLQHLLSLAAEVSHCDLVYTFCHMILRDSNIDTYQNNNEDSVENPRSQCHIYLKIQHNKLKRQISVFIGHVRYLALSATGQPPDTYVKTYIRPDPHTISKRKTQIIKASQNPTFNKELYYDIRLEDADNLLSTRVLEISVWQSGGIMDNHKMYMTYIPLQRLKNEPEDRKGVKLLEGWFSCDKNPL